MEERHDYDHQEVAVCFCFFNVVMYKLCTVARCSKSLQVDRPTQNVKITHKHSEIVFVVFILLFQMTALQERVNIKQKQKKTGEK